MGIYAYTYSYVASVQRALSTRIVVALCSQLMLTTFCFSWMLWPLHVWEGVDICPVPCPSESATVCTYARWTAQPAGWRQPGALLKQPLSACMRTLPRFKTVMHSLPRVFGRRNGTQGTSACACGATCMLFMTPCRFDCPALQPVQDYFPALFSPANNNMQLFMWRRDSVGMAHYIMDCFDGLFRCSWGPF